MDLAKLAIILVLLGGMATFFTAYQTSQAVNMSGADIDEMEFLAFVAKYKKSYASDGQLKYRMNVFSDNLKKINAHSKSSTYQVGINRFADMTDDEFNTKFTMTHNKQTLPEEDKTYEEQVQSNARPAAFDWNSKGVMQPIQNQGQCGSCWAFASISAVETAYKLQKNVTLKLSEQQLVDCARDNVLYPNHGCKGGEFWWAYIYTEFNDLCEERDYPYVAQEATCEHHSCRTGLRTTYYNFVRPNSTVALMDAVLRQPIATAVCTADIWKAYKGGIVENCPNCQTHGVVVIGYGTHSDKRHFFVIRNSWGPEWGEAGHIRVFAQNGASGGECGMLMEPNYPSFK